MTRSRIGMRSVSVDDRALPPLSRGSRIGTMAISEVLLSRTILRRNNGRCAVTLSPSAYTHTHHVRPKLIAINFSSGSIISPYSRLLVDLNRLIRKLDNHEVSLLEFNNNIQIDNSTVFCIVSVIISELRGTRARQSRGVHDVDGRG